MGREEKVEGIDPQGGSGASDPTAIGFELHRRQIEDMANAIREDRDPAITGAEGRKALALIRSIYESSEKGREVMLPGGGPRASRPAP